MPLSAAVTPTRILLDEHRVIERMLAVLEKMADLAFAMGSVDPGAARDAISFLREFADKCHHGKEEARLFPAMESFGLPSDAGPTAVMRAEHEMGRAHVRAMEAAVAAYEKGDVHAADRFAHEARGFADLLHDHIAKEDQILFPMADRMLPPSAQDKLMRDFRDFEARDVAPGTRERYEALANALVERYGADVKPSCASACGCEPRS